MSDQGIVFLTHVESERIFRHFQRLRVETKGLLSPLYCVHDPIQLLAFSKRIFDAIKLPFRHHIQPPDLRVDVKSGAQLLPNRFAQMRCRDGWYNYGFSDLACMPALLSERLRGCEYVWLIEHDVD